MDLRTIAFFRIGLSTVLLYDLGWRAFDLFDHYTDHGIIPNAALRENPNNHLSWSVYFIDGSPWFAGFLFFINAISLVFLFLGYRTRFFSIISWILLVSLHNRNPLILTGGDVILRMFLFWSIFLPLGAVWSLDARARKDGNEFSYKFFSVATVALYIQFLMIYFFAWFHKTGREWWPDGSAVYHALSIEYMATYCGNMLLYAPVMLLKILTYGVYWFEFLIPILFFFSGLRTWLAFLLIGMHAGFALTLALGVFPLAGVLTAIILIPSDLWDHVLGTKPSLDSDKPIFALNAIEKIFIIICLISAFFSTVTGIKKFPRTLPVFVKQFVRALRIDQNWALFSPRPSPTFNQIALEAQKKDGNKFDPPLIPVSSKNHRWSKFYRNIAKKRFTYYRAYYADYLCREWNSTHKKDPIGNLSIIRFSERIFEDHIRSDPEKKILLKNYACR